MKKPKITNIHNLIILYIIIIHLKQVKTGELTITFILKSMYVLNYIAKSNYSLCSYYFISFNRLPKRKYILFTSDGSDRSFKKYLHITRK